MTRPALPPLPIDECIPAVLEALQRPPHSVVIEAPPGAGKTTRVPAALLGLQLRGDIVVLEPRRIATRMAARRVADELGERPGETAGYSVRFEDVAGPKTRLRFVTEGILTRRLLADPELGGTAAVVLDEFHERHVHTDLALAWIRALKVSRRPELLLVVMSATLDAAPVAEFLGAPVVRSVGRAHPVAIEHLEQRDDRPLALQVVSAVRKTLDAASTGDALVFLPGAREIRQCTEALTKLQSERQLVVLPLHGDLSAAEQDRVLSRTRERKIILATNVAESSVTIDGVTSVIDSGLARVASHNVWSGMGQLELQKTCRASSIQRAGRAGRTAPGTCLRLFTTADFEHRPEFETPEIRRIDLSELALQLSAANASELPFFLPPEEGALRAAHVVLERLGALDESGAITPLGRSMAKLPLHPRAARLVLEGDRLGVLEDACVLAAMLGEKDIVRRARFESQAGAGGRATDRSDLLSRLDSFREAEATNFSPGSLRMLELDVRGVESVAKTSDRLLRAVRARAAPSLPEVAPTKMKSPDDLLLYGVLTAFPDRVVRRTRPGGRSLAMAGGGTAELSTESVVRHAEWMVLVDAEERKGEAGKSSLTGRWASAIESEWLLDAFTDRVLETASVRFNWTTERVDAISRLEYDGLVLTESALRAGSDEITKVLANAAKEKGAHTFAPEGDLAHWRARVEVSHRVESGIPCVSEEEVDRGLSLLADGKRSFSEMRGMSLVDALRALRLPAEIARIERLSPERITLAQGRSVKVHYELGGQPHVASRLQDFFGMRETPTIGAGRIPLLLHLLAPNQRAVQVTKDLKGFWERHYPGIRKELMRKYPRHAWPETV